MIRKPCCDFFVASCIPDGGAHRYRLYENGSFEHIETIPMPSPMYLQQNGDRLWAVLRAPFEDSKESGLAAYDIRNRKQVADTISTKGEVGCHLAVDDDHVYCANYIGGSVFKAPDKLLVNEGHGVDVKRQLSPHPHSVYLSKNKKFVLSCDLGLDLVSVYDTNLNKLSSAKVPDGAGARHLVFSKDDKYVYVANEMGGNISIFSFNDGLLEYKNSVSVLPDDFNDVGSLAAIKLSNDGTRLYVTERATQSIVTLSVGGESLEILDRTCSHGKEPRDFTLLANERFAVCTNQFDNSVALFSISKSGIPTFLDCAELPAPLCAIEYVNTENL